MIVQMRFANSDLLYRARLEIDGPFEDTGKLLEEVKAYAVGGSKNAFVYLEGENAIGYIELMLVEDIPEGCPHIEGLETLGHIARIGVVKRKRGKGIGTRLLKYCEAWFKLNKKNGVWLDYLAKNKEAVGLYEKNGYKNSAEFPDKKDAKRIRRVAIKKWS